MKLQLFETMDEKELIKPGEGIRQRKYGTKRIYEKLTLEKLEECLNKYPPYITINNINYYMDEEEYNREQEFLKKKNGFK